MEPSDMSLIPLKFFTEPWKMPLRDFTKSSRKPKLESRKNFYIRDISWEKSQMKKIWTLNPTNNYKALVKQMKFPQV